MIAARIHEIAIASPWLPGDYLRHLARVDPGPGTRRYGAEWFDGPMEPRTAFGAHVGTQFPSARLIARRQGHSIGYADWETGCPRLLEWAGSQQRVLHEYADIGEFVLSSVLVPGYDSRPLATPQPRLRIRGMAIGPWHDAGTELIARGILLPDGEQGALDALEDALPESWQLQLMRQDGDSARSIRPAAGGWEWCVDRHGSFGAWHSVSRADVAAELRSLAPFNDGSDPTWHAHLSFRTR